MVRIYIYVEASVGCLDVPDDELPRLLNGRMDVIVAQHGPTFVGMVMVMIPMMVDEARVRHMTDGNPLASGDDDVVDGQDRLSIHPHPGHLHRFF